MTALPAPFLRNPAAPLARRNPMAKLAAAAVLMVGLFLTIDPLTPALVLGVELAALLPAGIDARVVVRRLGILVVAGAGVFVATALFAEDRSGETLVALGPLVVTTGSLLAATAIALRIFAIALPGVIALTTIDPTDLADALVQQLHTSARFTFGALAAFRLVSLLGDEWRTLVFARRARGLDAGWSPIGRVRLFASTVFALLVAAIRRGVRLASAMEARGFGQQAQRSVARPIAMTPADWALIVAAVVVIGLASGISVATGQWTFLF